jgi:hypothetical protein
MAEWATIGGNLANLVKRTNTDIVGVLKIHSEVLAIVQQTFHTMIKTREDDGKQKLQITCFAEEKPVQRLGLTAVVCRLRPYGFCAVLSAMLTRSRCRLYRMSLQYSLNIQPKLFTAIM